jgi:hypothetical protein
MGRIRQAFGWLAFAAIHLPLFCSAALAGGPSSASYSLPAVVWSGAGGPLTGYGFRLNGGLGQPTAIGQSQSAGFILKSGFWYETPRGTPGPTATPDTRPSATPTVTPSSTPPPTATGSPPPPTATPQPQLDCSGAQPITCSQTIPGENTGAPSNVSTYSCVGWDESGPEVVYSFETPADVARFTATILNPSADLDLFVLDGCSEHRCVAYGDLSVTIENPGAPLYYIVVDGYQGAVGTYELQLDCVYLTPTPGGATATPAPPTATPLPGLPGDVDGDGRITSSDALLAFQIALGLYIPTPEEEARADVDQDGRVTSSDALCIFQEALGLPNSCFP